MVASTIPPKENSAVGLSQGEDAPDEPVAVELRMRYARSNSPTSAAHMTYLGAFADPVPVEPTEDELEVVAEVALPTDALELNARVVLACNAH